METTFRINPSAVSERDKPNPDPYYVALGLAGDSIMRCADCARLVRVSTLKQLGLCPHCGTRRVKEVQTLSVWEWITIRTGLFNFPHRREFLREFGRG